MAAHGRSEKEEPKKGNDQAIDERKKKKEYRLTIGTFLVNMEEGFVIMVEVSRFGFTLVLTDHAMDLTIVGLPAAPIALVVDITLL